MRSLYVRKLSNTRLVLIEVKKKDPTARAVGPFFLIYQ
jgi:hypothetical protein